MNTMATTMTARPDAEDVHRELNDEASL